MNSSKLAKAAAITAIVAVVSFLIAAVIGVASGTFQSVAAEVLRLSKQDGDGAVTVAIDEKKSIPAAGLQNVVVKAVSEDIRIHESSGESITARHHGKVSSTSEGDRPHLEINQNGTSVKVCVKYPTTGRAYSDAVLEVGIPRGFAGRLSAEGISSNITLENPICRELALKTISGDIEANSVRAVTGNVDVNSTSGNVELTFAKIPTGIAARTVSGDIHIGIPSNMDFALNAGSTSGDVTCDFPITLTDSHEGVMGQKLVGTVGSGKSTVTANTLSGDIEITPNGGI